MTADEARTGSLSDRVRSWAPKPTRALDRIERGPSVVLSSLLDFLTTLSVGDAKVVPPLWHWLHFLDWPRSSALAPDGHPRSSGFQPPISGRRRMFAGGRLTIERPLLFDRPAERTSSLLHVTPKRGRSGELLFTTVRSEVVQEGNLIVVDDQDFVYRSGPASGPAPSAARPAPQPSGVEASFELDAVSLFRFSALTANSHRIHYDAPYAKDVEGYPDLLVHGPLLVILMAQQARADARDREVRSIDYRLVRPLFAGEAARIVRRWTQSGMTVEIIGPDGQARATSVLELGSAGSVR